MGIVKLEWICVVMDQACFNFDSVQAFLLYKLLTVKLGKQAYSDGVRTFSAAGYLLSGGL
jgi:hypothetical protein